MSLLLDLAAPAQVCSWHLFPVVDCSSLRTTPEADSPNRAIKEGAQAPP